MTPGQRVTASAADMTLNVHGATTAKPKKPNTRHAAVASHTRAPVSFRLRRIAWTLGDYPHSYPDLSSVIRAVAACRPPLAPDRLTGASRMTHVVQRPS